MTEEREMRCTLCSSTIECGTSEPIADKKGDLFCCECCRDVCEQLRSSYLIDAGQHGLHLRGLNGPSDKKSKALGE